MKIYTYAIIDSGSALSSPRRRGSIKGLKDAHVYNIPYRDIGIVVSDLDEKAQNAIKDSILQHEKVVEKLMERFTVLPMKFSTVFSKKEAVDSMMKNYYDEFRANLDRLHNKVEFGLKVLWPGDKIRKNIADACIRNNCNVFALNSSPGRNFIKKKFKEYKIDKEFEKEANKRIVEIDKFFSKVAVEKKLVRLKSVKLLLNASYLVKKEKQNSFKEEFERLKDTSGEFKYLFSGPWPPYNFISLTKKEKL